MNERHGWCMTIIGATAVVLACLGLSVAVFLWVSETISRLLA